MKRDLTILNVPQIRPFVQANPFAVIYVSPDDASTFNDTLKLQLNRTYALSMNVGVLPLEGIDYTNSTVQNLVGPGMTNLGLSATEALLPGYYLFKTGFLVAYHPGTFDVSKLDPQLQGMMLKFLGLTALTMWIATKSFANGLLFLAKGAEMSTGVNIFQFFKEVLSAKSNIDIRKEQTRIFETDLGKAYRLLGISALATNDEVKKARNEKLKEYHPDKSASDKEMRTKMTAQINLAYELIMSSRSGSKMYWSAG